MPEQEKELQEALSQITYKGTPYEDCSWELVGEFLNQDSFEPSSFAVLDGRTMIADPMFADYGGVPPAGDERRFHGTGGGDRFDPNRRQVRSMEEEQEAADEIAEQLRAEHARELEAARAEAFQEGRIAAIEELDERMKIIEDRYASVLEDVGQQIGENLKTMEHQAVNLAIQISQKLIGTVVEINPEYILGIVREAIKLAGGAIIRSIRVSPQDHEFLSLLSLPKQFKEYDGTWNFEADGSVKSGCVVMTSGGEVDFQIEPAWERIKEKVVKVIAA
jgi:flagellar biosynthesis/type III secretory pathway protein FliH